MCRYHFFLIILTGFLFGWSTALVGQTGITGDAFVSLVAADETCNGMARRVEVHVDLRNLQGTNNELAGLNSFVLSFTLGSPNIFASALPGDTPVMDWGLITTQRSLITTHVTLVGWTADTFAPNSSYHVATILFSGLQGTYDMALDHAGSSLGSRVANGDGPGPISIDATAVSQLIEIPAIFSLDIHTGVSLWLLEDVAYALINTPNGPITIEDLVQLVNCGAE